MNCKIQVIDGQIISFGQIDNLQEFAKSKNKNTKTSQKLESLEKLEKINTNLIANSTTDSKADFQVVLLHGWASKKELWANLVSELLQKSSGNEMKEKIKLKILTLDLPGFGNSQKPKNDWFVSNYTDLVARFITKNCEQNIPIIIIGHSFGGRIGIKLTSELQTNLQNKLDEKIQIQNSQNSQNSQENEPKNQTSISKLSEKNLVITKLVLISSAGFVDNSAQNSLKKIIAKIVAPIFTLPILKPLKKQIYTKILKNTDYQETEMKKTFINVIDEDLSDWMSGIRIPTLLIFGKKDTETPPTFGARMNQLIHNSELKFINGDHFAFMNNASEVASLILDFLNPKDQ